MAFKIGGSLGKIANNVKKMNAGDVLLGGLTGGATLGYQAATGKSVAGQLKNQLGGVVAPPTVKAADPGGLQQASTDLLNPVADQFTNFGNTSQITSNVDPAFRQYQLGLANQLQMQANGQGPSVAQMQLQQATDRSLNQSINAMRSAAGPNAGLAARSAALVGSQQMGNMGANSAILRLQEQQQAQNALAGVASQGRAGDLTANSQNMDAQNMTQQNRLEGLRGLGNVRNAQLENQQVIYGAKNQATQNQAQLRAQRDSAILGAGANVISSALGSFLG